MTRSVDNTLDFVLGLLGTVCYIIIIIIIHLAFAFCHCQLCLDNLLYIHGKSKLNKHKESGTGFNQEIIQFIQQCLPSSVIRRSSLYIKQ